MANTPDVTILIPLFHESESLQELFEEISSVMKKEKRSYECIFVDDGSRDTSWQVISTLHKQYPQVVRGIRFRTHEGKASAYHAGFSEAKGKYIVTLDADLQDDPSSIPHFLHELDAGYDLVCGWKQQRKDSWVKNISSWFFNWTTNRISPVQLHDHNCGFKAYRRTVVADLDLYGELHRYIAVLISVRGYRVIELPVPHRKRIHGQSKYSAMRFIHGCLDLVTVVFLTRFQSRPLHLFGYFGMTVFCIGFLFALYLTIEKFVFHMSIGGRPLLLLSVMLMIMGVQVGITGLVGELITSQMQKKQHSYRIAEKI